MKNPLETKDFFFQLRTTEAIDLIVQRLVERLGPHIGQPKIITTIPDDKLLTKQEVRQLFGGISLSTVTAWMKSGKLPFHRKGRTVFFIKSEVLESLKKN